MHDAWRISEQLILIARYGNCSFKRIRTRRRRDRFFLIKVYWNILNYLLYTKCMSVVQLYPLGMVGVINAIRFSYLFTEIIHCPREY